MMGTLPNVVLNCKETPQKHVLPVGRVLAFRGKTMNGVYESNQDYVRVLLADDAVVIRDSVSHLLESEPAIKLMGVAENLSQTLQMAASLRPDVVLLDLHMPDSGAFEPAFVKSELALSGARVLGISLSSDDEDDEALQVLAESFGVATLLDKGRFGNELIPAILQK